MRFGVADLAPQVRDRERHIDQTLADFARLLHLRVGNEGGSDGGRHAAVPPSDWAVLGACLGLAAATMLFIFYIQPDASDLAPHRTKLDQLMERRDTIYDNLRDLRFEYRSGKYSESDYEAMKISMENEAAMVLAEIDQVTEAQTRRPRGPRPSAAAGNNS